MIKNFKTGKMIDTEKQYSVAKEMSKHFLSGAAKGAGIAGAINTAFPALVPTFGGMLVGASDISTIGKIGIGLGLASSPAVQISGLGILGIGAGVGALVGLTVGAVKSVKQKKLEKKAKTR